MKKFFEDILPTILVMIAGLLIIILIGSCAAKKDTNKYIYVCDKCNVRENFLEMR